MRKDILEQLKEHDRVSRKDVENTVFAGATKEEIIGRAPSDPATERQKRYLFVLGRELGLSGKDDIKSEYEIDSISQLTIEEAGAIIDAMHADLGWEMDDQNRVVKPAEDKKQEEAKGVWHRKSGVNYVGAAFAKCGQCVHFTGTLSTDGKCKEGVRKGTFPGKKVYPMTKDCFRFRGGDLEANIKVWKDKDEDTDVPF